MSHGAVPAPERIVLVGFMAAGKSTVGSLLARRLDWAFLDFDALIETRAGRPPGRLIREDGEAAFRRLETAVTEELAGRSGVVLAPGGGWAARPELSRRLGHGTVRVWLRIGADEALRRAEADPVDRPLLGPAEGRLQRVRDLLRAREPLYGAAEIAVQVDDREPAAVVDEILRRLDLDQEDDER